MFDTLYTLKLSANVDFTLFFQISRDIFCDFFRTYKNIMIDIIYKINNIKINLFLKKTCLMSYVSRNILS